MMSVKLASRIIDGTERNLQIESSLYDFSSNDYLGFSRSEELRMKIRVATSEYPFSLIGSTGSRLLSGNTKFAEFLEEEIAKVHHAKEGLIFNSGYAANSALFSCLPQKGDTIICDEYIHASVIDGARLSFARRYHFRHNDLEDLEKKLRAGKGNIFVAVESVYSMVGDIADLLEIARLCREYNASLIVDEAHAFGVWGTGLVDMMGIHSAVFARVITFGKALGLHGAIVLGNYPLRDYLINYARPFIYSTALPFALLIAIQTAYEHLLENPGFQDELRIKSTLLKDNLPPQELLKSTLNPTGIQCVFTNGSHHTVAFSNYLQKKGFDVRPIRSPTVPKGKERLRISMHVHNTEFEIRELCAHLNHYSIYGEKS